MSKLKSVPAFKTEADERKFWKRMTPPITSTGAKPNACTFRT